MSTDLDVAVVGAGIAGLTAAFELRRAGATVRVFEAADRVGGRMASSRHNGFTIDAGAEQLSTHGYRATWELLRRLGIPPTDVPLIGKDIAMSRDGRAHPGVASPHGLLSGAGLCVPARIDLLRFQLATAARGRDYDADRPESTPLGARTIADLGGRYHPDLHDYLLQPVAGGFFGWDTTRSAAAPMVSLMREVGPVSSWRTYRGGMDLMALRLADDVDVDTGCEVTEVLALPDRARVTTTRETVTARSVLLCVPAPVAARIHANPSDAERAFLSACTFTSALKVSCLLDRRLTPTRNDQLYALLTPRVEEAMLSGLIIDHAKHADRTPSGRGLISLMAAPTAIPDLFGAPDEQVAAQLMGQAERFLPGLGEATTATFVHRFRHALPEATPGALRLRSAFVARPDSPVDYAGDWVLLRPSSEGAVRSAAAAASRTLRRLASTDQQRSLTGPQSKEGRQPV